MASASEHTGTAVGEIAQAMGDVAQGAERQVWVDKRGRLFYAQVADCAAGELLIEPLERHNSYRCASAREVLAHWRKAGTPRRVSTPAPASPPHQLTL